MFENIPVNQKLLEKNLDISTEINNLHQQSTLSDIHKPNLPSNVYFEPAKPINRTISALRSVSFKNLETKIITTTSFLIEPIEYWTTIFNYSIGYGCLWRFPYYFHLCGGSVFFIPFILFFCIVGIPLLTMESALGQIFKSNPDVIFSKIKKKLYGLGLISTLSAFIINVYLSVISSRCLYFFFISFSSPLPWDFSAENSKSLLEQNFFGSQVINISEDNQTNKIVLGAINFKLLLCLAITWIVIFFVNFLNLKINSKVLYITSISPIVMLIIILLNSFSLPSGFTVGFSFYFFPSLSKLMDYKLWLNACNQGVFILMLGFNGNILFSSKKKENEDIYRRSLCISITVLLIGLISAFISSVYCGFIAEEIGIDNIEKIPFNKASLPFIVYPLALGMMQYSNLWSLLFFGMMVVISIQSQIIYYEGLSTYISESITEKYLSFKKSSLILCFFGFLFGIPFTTSDGFFILEWADRYATMVPLFLVILGETISIMMYIGTNTLREIIANKTGMVVPGYVFASSSIISPISMICLMVLSFIYHFNDLPSNIYFLLMQWGFMVVPFLLLFFFVLIRKEGKDDIVKKEDDIKELMYENPGIEMKKFI